MNCFRQHTRGDISGSPCVHTYMGKKFYPLAPVVEDIIIEDIAHALSLQCRFNGHTLFHYSVAEHSLIVSSLLPPETALWGLLHDASECYLPDVVSPLKPHLPGFIEIERRITMAIAERFGLAWPEPPEVKRVDLAVLAAEKKQVLGETYGPWRDLPPPAEVKIMEMSPRDVKELFLKRFFELTGGGK